MATVAVNARKPYTDAQVRDILSVAPTWANARAKAAAYGRTPKAIVQLWRWANTPERGRRGIREYEKKHHAGKKIRYFQQLVRVRKSIGWVMLY